LGRIVRAAWEAAFEFGGARESVTVLKARKNFSVPFFSSFLSLFISDPLK
jgi:hypothetical protein